MAELTKNSIKVLVVDDDARLRDLLDRYLTQNGFVVSTLPDARDLNRKLERDTPHLIVLDWMMPGQDGLAVCKDLRTRGVETPVLMLTAKADEEARVAGLEAGADDFLAKPFSPKELVARIHAILRRSRLKALAGAPSEAGGTVHFGPYVLDLSRRELRRGETVTALTTGEFAMLHVFVSHPREPLTRDRLMMLARGRGQEVFDRAIDVQISRLRRLIEPDPTKPRYIQTVWGYGYVFVPDA